MAKASPTRPRKSLNAAGVKEAAFDAYTPGEKDYSAMVSRLKQAGVTVIYIGGYYTEAALIIRQAKEQGMKVDPGLAATRW